MSNFNISSQQSAQRQQLIEHMMKNRNKNISIVKNISVPRINSNLNSAQTGATENTTILKSSEASEQKSFLEDTKVSETIESIVKSKNELKNESIEYAMRINTPISEFVLGKKIPPVPNTSIISEQLFVVDVEAIVEKELSRDVIKLLFTLIPNPNTTECGKFSSLAKRN